MTFYLVAIFIGFVCCFEPEDPVPVLTVNTLNGSFSYQSGIATIFYAFNSNDGYSSFAWQYDNSVQWFLQESPSMTQYLFLSYSASNSISEVRYMQQRLFSNMLKMNFSPQQIQDWQSRLHFAVDPVPKLTSTWIPSLLADWTSEAKGLKVTSLGKDIWITRLDATYGWVPFPTDGTASSLVFVSDLCAAIPPVTNVSGLTILSVLQPKSNCPFGQMIMNAQTAGAVGVIIFPYPNYTYTIEQMNCTTPEECGLPISIPAAMITYKDGKGLFDAINKDPKLTITYVTNLTSGFYVGADYAGNFIELGWQKYADLRILSWEAQWTEYKKELYFNLSLPTGYYIPVFNNQDMHESGVNTTILMPSMQQLAQYNRFDLDFSLGCPGTRDVSCDIWDYIVTLTVCADDGSLCFELGRWITPFRRRTGRWLTSVRQYLPLLAGKKCLFTAVTVGYTHWHATLNLRFSEPSASLVPHTTIPLFSGGVFNVYYNTKYTPISFLTPTPSPVKVELVAVISGHGSDSEGCAEFCVTSHHFKLNNNFFNVSYDSAGTPLGCTLAVASGAVPNEHGTWVYGRDGWCDGQNVRPWIVDVTQAVNFQSLNQITYFGWFNGTDPRATDEGAYIVMSSWLVFSFPSDTL